MPGIGKEYKKAYKGLVNLLQWVKRQMIFLTTAADIPMIQEHFLEWILIKLAKFPLNIILWSRTMTNHHVFIRQVPNA